MKLEPSAECKVQLWSERILLLSSFACSCVGKRQLIENGWIIETLMHPSWLGSSFLRLVCFNQANMKSNNLTRSDRVLMPSCGVRTVKLGCADWHWSITHCDAPDAHNYGRRHHSSYWVVLHLITRSLLNHQIRDALLPILPSSSTSDVWPPCMLCVWAFIRKL